MTSEGKEVFRHMTEKPTNDRWIKIKESELRLLLEIVDGKLSEKIIATNFNVKTACHYLRINQKKIRNHKEAVE
jgi:hypothetical protein